MQKAATHGTIRRHHSWGLLPPTSFQLIIKQKRNAFPKHSANVKIRGSYEKEKLSKVFLALTVIIITINEQVRDFA